MGQKINPIGFRLGINRTWDSRWFSRKEYGSQLLDDLKLRKFLGGRLTQAAGRVGGERRNPQVGRPGGSRGSPDGIRTRATALRGRRARPLHNGGPN